MGVLSVHRIKARLERNLHFAKRLLREVTVRVTPAAEKMEELMEMKDPPFELRTRLPRSGKELLFRLWWGPIEIMNSRVCDCCNDSEVEF